MCLNNMDIYTNTAHREELADSIVIITFNIFPKY